MASEGALVAPPLSLTLLLSFVSGLVDLCLFLDVPVFLSLPLLEEGIFVPLLLLLERLVVLEER